jgi:hypothetical protein
MTPVPLFALSSARSRQIGDKDNAKGGTFRTFAVEAGGTMKLC